MYVPLFLLVVVFFAFGVSNFENCDSNKCYRTLNNTHQNFSKLLKTFEETISRANITKTYDLKKLENDIQQVKDIENNIRRNKQRLEEFDRNLNNSELSLSEDQKIVDNLLESLNNISKYNTTADRILKEARENETKLKKLLKLGEEVSKKCKQVHAEYRELKNIIDEIVKDYDNVTKNYDDISKKVDKLNKNISDTNRETIKIKEQLEQLEFPTNLVNRYLLTSEKKVNETLEHLKDNINLLKDLLGGLDKIWNDQMQVKWNEVVDEIAKVQDDVKKMNEDLKKYEEAFVDDTFRPTVDDTSRDLLRQIKEKIANLEKELEAIEDLDEEKYKDYEKYLEDIKKKNMKLKESLKILDAVPDEEELKEVEAIIADLQDIVDLYDEWKILKQKVEILRKNRDEILKVECNRNNSNSGIIV